MKRELRHGAQRTRRRPRRASLTPASTSELEQLSERDGDLLGLEPGEHSAELRTLERVKVLQLHVPAQTPDHPRDAAARVGVRRRRPALERKDPREAVEGLPSEERDRAAHDASSSARWPRVAEEPTTDRAKARAARRPEGTQRARSRRSPQHPRGSSPKPSAAAGNAATPECLPHSGAPTRSMSLLRRTCRVLCVRSVRVAAGRSEVRHRGHHTPTSRSSRAWAARPVSGARSECYQDPQALRA